MPGIATSAPGGADRPVASATRTIRVGAGGMMVPNHSPLHLIEVFRTLRGAPSWDESALDWARRVPIRSRAAALHPGREHDVDQRLAELVRLRTRRLPARSPFPADHADAASDVALPPIWMLDRRWRARHASRLRQGLRYAFAGHFAMRFARQAIAHYYAHFRPSATLAEPEAILAVTVVCGEERDEHARRLAAPLSWESSGFRTGKAAPLASIEEALAYRFTPEEESIAEDFLNGSGDRRPGSAVRARLPRNWWTIPEPRRDHALSTIDRRPRSAAWPRTPARRGGRVSRPARWARGLVLKSRVAQSLPP